MFVVTRARSDEDVMRDARRIIRLYVSTAVVDMVCQPLDVEPSSLETRPARDISQG
jgi:hypothetical protein